MSTDQEFFTLADLNRWKNSQSVLPSPRPVLAVFGHPVAHSLSPQIHNPGLRAIGREEQYIRVDVPKEQIAEGISLARDLGLQGLNCTIPHKFVALEAVDVVDAHAKRLGAINTILFESDGKSVGFNTDGPGFARAIREEFSVDLHDLRVLIIGAGGGAGRAAAFQCAYDACERLVLVNRTRQKADLLAHELRADFEDDRVLGQSERLEVIDWNDQSLREALATIDLIVNASSVGMKPSDPEIMRRQVIEPHHLVYDMIYSPRKTRLLQAAEAEGARGANGLSMLLHQGAISFEHWFQCEAPLTAMRAGLPR